MSRATFAAYFKTVAGMSPLSYLTKWRMRSAIADMPGAAGEGGFGAEAQRATAHEIWIKTGLFPRSRGVSGVGIAIEVMYGICSDNALRQSEMKRRGNQIPPLSMALRGSSPTLISGYGRSVVRLAEGAMCLAVGPNGFSQSRLGAVITAPTKFA